MKDLREDLKELLLNLSRLPPTNGARTVQFVGCGPNVGTSSVAASFALLAATRASRSAWLVDLDFKSNRQYEGFRRGFNKDVGRPGRAYDASLKTRPIYRVSDYSADLATSGLDVRPEASSEKLLTAHQIDGTRLMVTRFRNERLRPAQSAVPKPHEAWWLALRRITDWIVVDTPPLTKSGIALPVAPEMDGVVMVLHADRTSARDAQNLQTEIEANGGIVLGTVMNGARYDTRLMRRLFY